MAGVYDSIAVRLHHRFQQDLPEMSVYALTMTHPTHLATTLQLVHKRINDNSQTYVWKADDIAWDKDVYPQLLQYFKDASPNNGTTDAAQRITSPEKAHQHILFALGPYFVDNRIRQKWTYAQALQQRAGPMGHSRILKDAPYKIPEPMRESYPASEMMFHEQRNQAFEQYNLNTNPYRFALERGVQAQGLAEKNAYDGTWDGNTF